MSITIQPHLQHEERGLVTHHWRVNQTARQLKLSFIGTHHLIVDFTIILVLIVQKITIMNIMLIGLIHHQGDCEDTDECTNGELLCSHQCINTGWTNFDSILSGTQGQDLEPLSIIILSSVGSAYCECPQGFDIGADNQTCRDINEVTNNNLYTFIIHNYF